MDLIDLSLGQPLGPTPQGAVDAAHAALRAGCEAYSPPLGLPSLRQAAARAIEDQTRGSWDLDCEVMITSGATTGLVACILALSDPGDAIWVPDPGWQGFTAAVEALGRRVLRWSLQSALPTGPRPRLLLLACPDNPTGRQPDRDTIHHLRTLLAADPGLCIVSDETYHDLVYDDAPHISPAGFPDLAPHTVVLRSLSKSHAMAGWRVGWLVAPAEIAARIAPVLRASHACPSTMAQYAALWILQQGAEATSELRQRRQARRDRLQRGLAAVPGLDPLSCQGGLYLFPSLGGSSRARADLLREHAGVRVVPGSAFGPGGEGSIRLCFDRNDDILDQAIERLVPFLRMWVNP